MTAPSFDADTHAQLLTPLDTALQTSRTEGDHTTEIVSNIETAHAEAERVLPTSVWVDRDYWYDELETRIEDAPPDSHPEILESAISTVFDETFHLVEEP